MKHGDRLFRPRHLGVVLLMLGLSGGAYLLWSDQEPRRSPQEDVQGATPGPTDTAAFGERPGAVLSGSGDGAGEREDVKPLSQPSAKLFLLGDPRPGRIAEPISCGKALLDKASSTERDDVSDAVWAALGRRECLYRCLGVFAKTPPAELDSKLPIPVRVGTEVFDMSPLKVLAGATLRWHVRTNEELNLVRSVLRQPTFSPSERSLLGEMCRPDGGRVDLDEAVGWFFSVSPGVSWTLAAHCLEGNPGDKRCDALIVASLLGYNPDLIAFVSSQPKLSDLLKLGEQVRPSVAHIDRVRAAARLKWVQQIPALMSRVAEFEKAYRWATED